MHWREVLAAAQSAPVPRPALDRVVREVWPGATVEHVGLLPGGLGSVLHRVDLVGGPLPAVVLRQLLVEFDDDAETVRREAAVHAAAAGAGLPVPRVHWADPEGTALGRPALLLDLVAGTPLVGGLDSAPGRAAMAAALHGVASVPTRDLTDLRRLDTLDEVRSWPFRAPEHSPVVDAPALHAAVAAASPAFVAGDVLVHMDLHAGNVLWDGLDVTGVLDWPGAAIGNPLVDEAYCWMDTCLAFGRDVGDALQAAIDAGRPGAPPTPEEVHLWRGTALLRGLPSPGEWTEAYVAMGIEVDESTVEERYVALVDEYLGKG